MKKIPVTAVVGPTASGKTGLAASLAKHFDGEVVSFDSMQLYKGMDIATAKPTAEEMQGVTHHMISCVDNTEVFSVAKYISEANKVIDDIVARGKRVILVGGTGLYLDALIDNIEFLDDKKGEKKRLEIRRELKAELDEKGPEAMHEKLA
ncbi:MAG: tRNA (adenosine(37)-N6)-dimethylallyltransferase MiaA, partial [Clostridia bacterium]|nr:tRNA (adenosine(37)-N6)-dimethylallyltransferase MiaA [Clostridia bacterium]